MYTLTQTISISSKDMVKVPAVSRSVTSLIKDGVENRIGVSVLSLHEAFELKITCGRGHQGRDDEGGADRQQRHGRLGKLVEARMGVMQINPKSVTATQPRHHDTVPRKESPDRQRKVRSAVNESCTHERDCAGGLLAATGIAGNPRLA